MQRTLLLVAGAVRSADESQCLAVSEWDRFLEAVEFHGLTALAHRFFQRACGDIPTNVAAALASGYLESARRALILCAWLSDVAARFDAAAIPAIVLKGPPLADALYSDPALRPSFDLDFLVHPSDLDRTLAILAEDGYTLPAHLARFPSHILRRLDCEVTLRHPQRAPIDLHWALAPADRPFPLDPDVLWRTRDAAIAGGCVRVLTRESLFVYLAAHGAKHGWARLLWVSDIARLVRTPLDWDEAMRLTRESHATPVVHVALLLAHDLLNAPVLGTVISAARADPVARHAAAAASERLQRMPPREPSTFERTSFTAMFATSMSAKSRHWAAAVVAPQEEDLARWRLAPRLIWLYRPLRVQRLIRKYGRYFLGF